MAKKKRKKKAAKKKAAKRTPKKRAKRAGGKPRARKAGRARSTKDDPNQDFLLETQLDEAFEATPEGGVECLGQHFESDDARREHFQARLKEGLEELHEKLAVPFTGVDEAVHVMQSVEKWPMGEPERLREMAGRMRRDRSDKVLLQRWKDQVGFPHGEIEDILRLSDPPYYTACPNPFLAEMVDTCGTKYDASADSYRREPFAFDVTEGKTDPIYNAHSYHTKVPHKAIMRYILHYTDPGDIVFDGFCGSGMTGVAALLCHDKGIVESLTGSTRGSGRRLPILCELSPAATFIASGHVLPPHPRRFSEAARSVHRQTAAKLSWLYETEASGYPVEFRRKARKRGAHVEHGGSTGFRYAIWADVLQCPNCGAQATFWELGLDFDHGKVNDSLRCGECRAEATKNQFGRAHETVFDPLLGHTISRVKQQLVMITFSHNRHTHEKDPEDSDFALLDKAAAASARMPVAPVKMMFRDGPWGDQWRDGYHHGVTHVHHFFTSRNLLVFGTLWKQAQEVPDHRVRNALLMSLTAMMRHATRLCKLGTGYYFSGGGGAVNAGILGTLYIPSLSVERNILSTYETRYPKLARVFKGLYPATNGQPAAVSTSSATCTSLPADSVDYVFVDPPFGSNLAYSELNFLWESWLATYTNQGQEAIMSPTQAKDLHAYEGLMTRCFVEMGRILKPGRWLTVEFHNSRNAVWNAIQQALLRAGFVVADVRVLEKKQGAFNQVVAAGAVKQDLVISAYKPNGGLEERFKLEAGSEEGVWDFLRTHLRQLPPPHEVNDRIDVVVERQNFLLYDRMVAFHVQRGVTVPLSAAEFYAGLSQRFIERDGMYFLPEQAAEYDQKRMGVQGLGQTELFLNVINEETAIRWLGQRIRERPQTFQELHPQFMKEIGGWDKHEVSLELSDLLGQNFLCYDGEGEIPEQITEKLELDPEKPGARREARDKWYVPDARKAVDLEHLRERALLKEFQEYRESTQRKLKAFRLEAVRAGFKRAWQDHDYKVIIEVAGKIPDSVLQEDPKLLMFYDNAVTRTGEEE